MEKLRLFLAMLRGVLFRGPGMLGQADAWLQAWNRHDIDAIVALTGSAAYQDSLTPSGVTQDSLAEHAGMLLTAFPDLRFELDGPLAAGDGCVAARYVLHARHDGPLPGRIGFRQIEPTGRQIALSGALFIDFRGGRITAVRNHFDQAALGEALGFQALIVPQTMGDYRFGAYYRLNHGSKAPPEALGTTWISIKGGEAPFEHVATITRDVLESLSEQPGFITGIVGAQLPDENGEAYGFTVSAWEQLENMDQILPNAVHKDVVHQFMKEKVAYATHSRVYQLVRDKPLMIACEACGKKNNAHNKSGLCSKCKAPLAEAPAYW